MTPERASDEAHDPLALVNRGFDAFDRGDVEAVLALADPEVEVYMPNSMPNGGTYLGHDGYLRWIGNWLDAWDEFTVERLGSELVGEAHVVTRARQRGVGRGSGIPVEMDVWYVNEVRGSVFVALHLYPTEAEAFAAAERREAAAE